MMIASLLVLVVILVVTSTQASLITANNAVVIQARLYSGSSTVEARRRYRVPLSSFSQGYNTVVLEGLPLNTEDTSIRLAAQGNMEIVSTNVKTNKVHYTAEKVYIDTKARLERQLESLLDELQGSEMNERLLNAELNSLGILISPSSMDLNTDKLNTALTFYKERAPKIEESLREIKRSTSKLNKQITSIRSELDALQRSGEVLVDGKPVTLPQWKSTKDYHIQVHIDQLSSETQQMLRDKDEKDYFLDFNVTYETSPAHWSHDYDMRVVNKDHDKGSERRQYRLLIDLFANIAQSTGENWDSTKVILSTGYPGYISNPVPPTTKSISFNSRRFEAGGGSVNAYHYGNNNHNHNNHNNHIHSKSRRSFHAKEAASASMGAPMMMEMAMDMNVMQAESPEITNFMQQDANYRIADTSISGDVGLSYEMELPHLMNITSISSISSMHRSLISTVNMEVQMLTYCVPSQSLDCSLTLYGQYAPNPAIPLLPSDNVRISVQGLYSGVISVPSLQFGANLRLTVGKDKHVEIKHVRVLDHHGRLEEEEKTSWFTKDMKKFHAKTEEFSISAKNLRKHGLTFLLMTENIPKSTHDDIKLDIIEPLPSNILSFDEFLNKAKSQFSQKINNNNNNNDKNSDNNNKNQLFPNKIYRDDEFIELVVKILELESNNDNNNNNSNSHSMFDSLIIVKSSDSNNIFWLKWMKNAEMYQTKLKYRITWPEDKAVFIE